MPPFVREFLDIFVSEYNYPQELDSAIRCMIACKNIEGARQSTQPSDAQEQTCGDLKYTLNCAILSAANINNVLFLTEIS